MQSIRLHVCSSETSRQDIKRMDAGGKKKEQPAMANSRQFCPRCHLQTLKCIRTMPTGIDGHPLESSRLSIWQCLNRSCRARFQLETPEGKLKPVKNTAP